jgi:hypothetical protein
LVVGPSRGSSPLSRPRRDLLRGAGVDPRPAWHATHDGWLTPEGHSKGFVLSAPTRLPGRPRDRDHGTFTISSTTTPQGRVGSRGVKLSRPPDRPSGCGRCGLTPGPRTRSSRQHRRTRGASRPKPPLQALRRIHKPLYIIITGIPDWAAQRRLVMAFGYSVAAVDAHELNEAWFNRALESAGVSRERWHPTRGVDENRRIVEAVYGYYGRLFLEHPYLKWAGMASMIGPAFYAGFRDLCFLPDAGRRAVGAVFGRVSGSLAKRAGGDLGFYETTFLTMQKKIFEDQATMHEAYLACGIPQIEEFYRERIIDVATLNAWRQIDTGRRDGDTALVDRGNRTLLFREQHDIIERFYVRMLRHHWPEGPVFMYLLTLAGAPSVPGAHSYPERYPLTFVAPVPGAAISVQTPLADGTIAIFADRWKLIDDDTLPDYLAFVRDRADEARALVATPVSQRVTRYRLRARACRLVAAALTRWDVDLRAVPAQPRALVVRGTEPLVATDAGRTVIDLTGPPTRTAVDFPEGTDSRVWMKPHRRSFHLAVTLPGRRVYRAEAEMAVMLSSTRGGDPDRLTVQLPSAGLVATERLIADYAAEWGFPTDAAAVWRSGAERRVSSDREYSTRVFTPDDVGFAHLEFQVSQHVHDNDLVVTALFSWDSHVG